MRPIPGSSDKDIIVLALCLVALWLALHLPAFVWASLIGAGERLVEMNAEMGK